MCRAVGHLGDGSRRMGAHRAGAHQNDRVLCLADDFACRRDMGRVRIEVMHLLALEGHCVGGHLGNVLGQVDVSGTRLSFFGVLERQPDDLAYRVRADDLFGTLGDGSNMAVKSRYWWLVSCIRSVPTCPVMATSGAPSK